jgi:uncharacterized membrane protein YsdA (DUF1294 family)
MLLKPRYTSSYTTLGCSGLVGALAGRLMASTTVRHKAAGQLHFYTAISWSACSFMSAMILVGEHDLSPFH